MKKKVTLSPTQSQENVNNLPPVGCALRHTLRESGITVRINRIAWSPDGRVLASPSYDRMIRLWDTQTGQLLRILRGFSGSSHVTFSVAWSPDGKILAAAPSSANQLIHLWSTQTGKLLRTLRSSSGSIFSLAWSPDGKILAAGGVVGAIFLWDTQTWQSSGNLELIRKPYLKPHQFRDSVSNSNSILCLAWSPDGEVLALSSADQTVCLWNVQARQLRKVLQGHFDEVLSVVWSPDGKTLASGSKDKTIRIWESSTGQPTDILEGHTGDITSVSFSSDGKLLASKSRDGSVRIWHTSSKTSVAIEEPTREYLFTNLAFHPHAPVLATLGERDTVIRIWDLDVATLTRTVQTTPSVHYTTAKIALVGDSGVGKTGLGHRIAEDIFRVTESTHGQQFWVVEKLSKTRDDGTQCEAVLWDFAGQLNFRPIHALFLEDIDLALILFDPTRPDTLMGVDFWLKQLSYGRHRYYTILVAARSDVSKLSLPPAELEAFCQGHNIRGGFISTSAKTSAGVDALLEMIRQQIDWISKPATITTETFKRIKDYILALKANPDRKNVLVSPAQLRILLEATDRNWQFSDEEMLTAVGHLQNHGYVTILRRSSDEFSILLVPDLLINLSASYMLKAQSNERGLGSLEEGRALRNEYRFAEMEHLNDEERDILLNVVTELFLKHNICFRESIDNQTFLIFPSLIFDRPPRMIEDTELVEDTTYFVTGQVENIYPALVVLLGYSPSLQRIGQWRKQAQYETLKGAVCCFKLANDNPGEIELVLYYGKDTPEFARSRFQGLFEEILYTRNVLVRKYLPIFCHRCGLQQERHTVIKRIQESKAFLFCEEDGEKINLPNMTERINLSTQDRAKVAYEKALSKMRTTYEAALVRVKGLIRDREDTKVPTCFVSYAWGLPEHEQWVLKLADDLRNADIDVVLDQWDNPAIGSSVTRFISRIEESDFIIVVGTPSYQQKYENKQAEYGSVVAAEVDLINVRLTGTEEQKSSILPLLLDGEERTALPPLLHRRVYGNFTREKEYFVSLFDLVLTLYHIPFSDVVIRDLRADLRKEVQTLAATKHYYS